MKLRLTLAEWFSPGPRGGGWPARVMGVVAWLVAGYTAVFWGLQWGGHPSAGGMVPVPAVVAEVDSVAVARALGGGVAPVQATAAVSNQPAAGQRFSLQGILSSASTGQDAGHGVALIAVDGQKARPFAQGAVIDGQWVVRRVERKVVWLAPAAQNGEKEGEFRLEMPTQSVSALIQNK